MKHFLIRLSILSLAVLLGAGQASARFVDVDTTHPNFQAIDFMQSIGVVEGYASEIGQLYKPLDNITRAAALKIMLRTAGTPLLPGDDSTIFPDVPEGEWFAPYVFTAAQQGIVKGFNDGRFHPSAQVTRAEYIKMLSHLYQAPVRPTADSDEWYAPYFDFATEFRILDTDEVSPHELLTRGDIAEYTYRVHIVASRDFQRKYVYSGSGLASYYSDGFDGKPTANGEIFDSTELTAAHRTLPFGTRLRVTHEDQSVIVRINDRGPYHENRIIDLSEAAFEALAPVSRGVLAVDFEVYSAVTDDPPAIPETIRSYMSPEFQLSPLPDEVTALLDTNDTPAQNNDSSSVIITPRVVAQPLFDQVTTFVSKDFFDNATLYESIPTRVPVGQVMLISGTAKESGHERVRVFMKPRRAITEPAQPDIHFTGDISGRNFSFPIMFLEEGVYDVGLVFDDFLTSKVFEMHVAEPDHDPRYMADSLPYESDIEISVIPEDRLVHIEWTNPRDIVTQIQFNQNRMKKKLLIQDSLSEVFVPYEYFDDFDPTAILSVDLSQADSKDGTIAQRVTNWKKVAFENFVILPGFPDSEMKEKIGLHNFPRFLDTPQTYTVTGFKKDTGITIDDQAYLIWPTGQIRKFDIDFQTGGRFEIDIEMPDYGTYVLEINSTEGEILFNRAIYVSEEKIIPVADWSEPVLYDYPADPLGVLAWTNSLREANGLQPVRLDNDLSTFAGNYARRMQDEDFISHTDPEGRDFATRVLEAGFVGSYGENLSFATNFPLTLMGLENSASHRDNILNPSWTRVGIGLAESIAQHYHIVQVFGDDNPLED